MDHAMRLPFAVQAIGLTHLIPPVPGVPRGATTVPLPAAALPKRISDIVIPMRPPWFDSLFQLRRAQVDGTDTAEMVKSLHGKTFFLRTFLCIMS